MEMHVSAAKISGKTSLSAKGFIFLRKDICIRIIISYFLNKKKVFMIEFNVF
jgi:hypothetical protein